MSNYFYKGTSINNFFATPWSSQTSTTMSQVFTGGISTGRSNYNIERFSGSQIGYQINGTDVTSYACPTCSDYRSSDSVNVPSWASAITVVCISGGGGGGAGTNGHKKNNAPQGPSKNGGGGGGGGAGEYKIYRGYPVSGGAPVQITVGGGGGGGVGPSADGGGGGDSYVKVNGVQIIHTSGGIGGQGGTLGSNGPGGGGRGYNTYYAEHYNQGSTYGTSSNGGGTGTPSRVNVGGGNINQPQGDYLPLSQFSGGGNGGMGSNYDDQGRADGGGGQNGFVRIYWMV